MNNDVLTGWNTFTFVIGTTDDFESIDALLYHIGQVSLNNVAKDVPPLNYSTFEFDAPAGLDEDVVTMIGRGMAFSEDWCMDDTVSCVVKGVV